jgi:hypothetical protein
MAAMSTPQSRMSARLVATLCGAAAALCLIASLALAPPLAHPPAAAGWTQMLPLLAALLGLLGCVASAVFGVARAAPAPVVAPPPPPPPPLPSPDIPPPRETVREMAEMLEEQRTAFAAFRESCGTATHDAMMVGARLAGVALDAEARLIAGVSHLEQAAAQPAGTAAARAAEATLRIERALPELAELIRRGMQANGPAAPAPADGAAALLGAAADGAARSLGAIVAEAAGQIAAFGELGEAMRRDTMVLTEMAARADAAVARLPVELDALRAANEELAETASMLRLDGTTLAAAGHDTAAAAGALRLEAAHLVEASGVLRVDTGALAASTQDAVIATRILAATSEGAAAAVTSLTEAAGTPRGRGEALDPHAATEQAMQAMRQESAVLRAAAMDVVAAGGNVAKRLANASDTAAARIESAVDVAARTTEALGDAAGRLSADGAALATSSRATEQATAALRQEAAALRALGQDMAGGANGLAARLAEATDAATARIEAAASVAATQTAQALTEASAMLRIDSEVFEAFGRATDQATEALSAAGAEVAASGRRAIGGLANAAAEIEAAGRRIAEAGARVADRLAADGARAEAAMSEHIAAQIGRLTGIAEHAEAQVALLPTLAAQVGEAAGRLGMLPRTALRLEALTGQLVAIAEARPVEPAALIALGKAVADIAASVERLESGLVRHDAAGLTVAAAMTQMRSAMAAVADTQPGAPALAGADSGGARPEA